MQPKGAVDVTTLVQVGEAEQAVTVVVVFGRGVGRAQRTLREVLVRRLGGWLGGRFEVIAYDVAVWPGCCCG